MFSELYKKDNLMITPSDELINQISEKMKLEIKKSTEKKRIPVMRYATAAVAVIEVIAAAVMIPIFVKNSNENSNYKLGNELADNSSIVTTLPTIETNDGFITEDSNAFVIEDEEEYDVAEDEEAGDFGIFSHNDMPGIDERNRNNNTTGELKKSDRATAESDDMDIEAEADDMDEDSAMDNGGGNLPSIASFDYGIIRIRTDYDYKSYLYWTGPDLWNNLTTDNLIPPNIEDNEEPENPPEVEQGDNPVSDIDENFTDEIDMPEPAPNYIVPYDPGNDEPYAGSDIGDGVDGFAGVVTMPELRTDLITFKQFADEFFMSKHMIDYFHFPTEQYYAISSVLNIPEFYSLAAKYINSEISYMENDYRYLSYYNIQFSIMTEFNFIDIYITPDDFLILRLRDNYTGAYILPLDNGTYNKMWNYLNTNYCR